MGAGGDHKEKTTKMVLNVDLKCPCCYKKAKKVLRKTPQVRNQEYDEKNNTITITVVCCSPERIRDKLCCKGGKAIQSIEIKPPKTVTFVEKETEKSKGKEKETEKSKGKAKEPEKSKEKEKETEKPKDKTKETEKPKVQEKPTVIVKPKDGPTAAMVATPWISEPIMMMPPVQGYPQAAPGWGDPCYQYYGTPVPPPPGPYYGNYSYGYGPGPGPYSYGKGCYVNSDYFNEENAQGCTIM